MSNIERRRELEVKKAKLEEFKRRKQERQNHLNVELILKF